MNVSLQHTKTELIQWLSSLEDTVVIDKIVAIKNNEDWWDKLNLLEKQSIEKGIADAEKGRLHTHEKARAIYEKWL